MNRDEHRAWLERLAVENQRRRAEALPELERKEALLAAQRARLEAAQASEVELEVELEAARREPGGVDAD